MVELIIAEKPSAAKKIAEALADGKPTKRSYKNVPFYELSHKGKSILVGCAVGHVYTLAERVKSKGFLYPVFDVVWTASYTVDRNASYTREYIEALKKICAKAKRFTVACDYDTEGSLIGLNVLRFVCKQEDARRMKFSTLTKPDLIKAYDKASKTLDWGQARAGETRHYLDFFYGINVSRALTCAIKSAGVFKILSTGRVQGPALKIVVDREREILAFKPVPFWELHLLGQAKRKSIAAMHGEGKFWDGKQAKSVFKKCEHASKAEVSKLDRHSFKQKPPHPFDLTTLQTEAYRMFGLKPKPTLAIAQSLYLMGVISYPRTSSQEYPAAIGFQKIIGDLAKQKKYQVLCALLKGRKLTPANGKKKDPAHPAIYPTGLVPHDLDPRQVKVYDLIVKRFLATFGNPATRETVKVHLDVNGEEFIAKGTRTVDRQWHELYDPYVKMEEEELPPLQKNDMVKIKKLTLEDKHTQPPKRFTPASLVRQLERQSLGTKATRSEIVETLYKRKYIVDDSIRATKFGMEIAVVLERHVPEIVDPELTREFEKDMDAVQEHKKKMSSILDNAKKVLTKILADFKKKEKQVGEELALTLQETRHIVDALGPCPKCGKGTLVIKPGKYGRFAACDQYPDCKTTIALPKTGKIESLDKKCEICGYPMIKISRRGKHQELCLNNECPSKDVAEPVQTKKCTKCGKGNMVVRKSLYGAFLACDQYPKCKHTEKLQHNV
ncbi:DNA topoisomerase I [Candidatus Woesearchaeota archaeon]|nr:DNA topoisomerase I [Candidatus Woesearchaeota archaeon]